MSAAVWDASDLLAAFRHATATLRADIDEVNALNVFPVPDGDTGSNMLATMQAAVDEASALPGPERNVTNIAEALSRGGLMGARGNSGVILSQWLRGVAVALGQANEIDAARLADALESGCRASVAAVAHPVEGTILTVSRDAAAATRELAAEGATIEALLAGAVDAASDSVARTPQLLHVLADAGVVDAGGRGLELLLRGALAYVRRQPVPVARHDDVAFPSFAVNERVGYGYETVFMVLPEAGARLDLLAIRERLDRMGESVLVAGDENLVKVHIHNERPDEVIAYGLSLGSLAAITVENLDREAHEVRWRGRQAPSQEPLVRTREPRAGPTVVAVAPGPGLAALFAELGAAGVVTGGQAANPSTGDLVESIRATGAREVIVLANNPNVRMAAQQAGALLPDVSVDVVPSRNAAEGIAAILALNPGDDIATNARRMSDAARSVQTMQVTAAVRDARVGSSTIRRGEHIVLAADEQLLAVDADRQAAVLQALRRSKAGFELITLYRGKDVVPDEADALRRRLVADFRGVEVEVVDGGQPHYSFLIAVE